MSLPININELINSKVVESERLEFKTGWNPQDVLHSITAFANDINNWGGGYIIIGIEEKNGVPILPPKGLNQNQIDKILKELLSLCHKISPNYFPIAEPVIFQKKYIIVIWVPGGDTRPYKAPLKLGEKSQSFYFVRHASSTLRANQSEERRLIELASKIPFDDRINHNAGLHDIKLTLIQSFLKEVSSPLLKDSAEIPFVSLCKSMHIISGPDEDLHPRNAGLLFFNDNPENFFRGAKIEIVEFHDDIGDNFTEKIFTGPIHIQLKQALQYLKNSVIKDKVQKIPEQAESKRTFNYPYSALEEAVANAVYHRSYENENTIEISVWKDRIEILSFPGPLPPINNDMLKKDRIVARDYRNRRIGDFLKELQLTEGRSTGIPKIRKALKSNGSPSPVFETDNDGTYFLSIFAVHPVFGKQDRDQAGVIVGEQISVQVSVQVNLFNIINLDDILELLDSVDEQDSVQVTAQVRAQVKELVHFQKIINLYNILSLCLIPQSRYEILEKINLSNHPKNFKTNIGILITDGILKMTVPEKPNSPKQRYVITDKGKKLLEIIEPLIR